MTKIRIPRGVYTARIYSQELWALETHWSERHQRTHICPRQQCVACSLERPKVRGYALGKLRTTGDRTELGLLEIAAGTLDQLARYHFNDWWDAAGWTWAADPSSSKGHLVRGVARCTDLPEGEVCNNEQLLSAIERLFNLPAAMHIDADGIHQPDAPAAWIHGHRETLIRRVAAAFTPPKLETAQ